MSDWWEQPLVVDHRMIFLKWNYVNWNCHSMEWVSLVFFFLTAFLSSFPSIHYSSGLHHPFWGSHNISPKLLFRQLPPFLRYLCWTPAEALSYPLRSFHTLPRPSLPYPLMNKSNWRKNSSLQYHRINFIGFCWSLSNKILLFWNSLSFEYFW